MKLDELKVILVMTAFVWIFAILMGIGWVLNIIDLVGMVGGEIGIMFILRVVGVFAAPLGSILGWFF